MFIGVTVVKVQPLIIFMKAISFKIIKEIMDGDFYVGILIGIWSLLFYVVIVHTYEVDANCLTYPYRCIWNCAQCEKQSKLYKCYLSYVWCKIICLNYIV